MTPRNEKVIELYLRYIVMGQPPSDKKATLAQVWIDAGYKAKSEKVASQNCSEFLKKPEIALEVERRQNEIMEREKITTEKILRELALIGFINMADFYKPTGELKQINELSRDQTAVIQEVVYDKKGKFLGYKLFNKIDGLDRLGRNKKLFTDKVALGADPDNQEGLTIIIGGEKKVT